MKNACFLPKIAEGWDFGWFGKFHKIIKIGHFLKMKKFFESGFLMSHEGSFPMGVKLSKSKKVYPKCVVAQRLGLLMENHPISLHEQNLDASTVQKIASIMWAKHAFPNCNICNICKNSDIS